MATTTKDTTGDGFNDTGTIKFDVMIPPHDPRIDTPLYIRTRKLLITRDKMCFVCQRTARQSGAPLEAHHHPIMRSMMNMVDWPRFIRLARLGHWGPNVQAFNWDKFSLDDVVKFVDDMRHNGMLLCATHHRAMNAGIHALPYPLFLAQAYGLEGYQFSKTQTLVHADDDPVI